MRDRIHIVENAAGVAELGRLADRAAVIAVRGLGEDLSDEDRKVLKRVLAFLEEIQEFSTPDLPARTSLQTMAPFHVLDETFEALSTASETPDLVPVVEGLIRAVNAILEGTASESDISEVAAFFDRLSALTLARSTDLARPYKDRYRKWTTTARGSSVD